VKKVLHFNANGEFDIATAKNWLGRRDNCNRGNDEIMVGAGKQRRERRERGGKEGRGAVAIVTMGMARDV
jgi:hypothetical protein